MIQFRALRTAAEREAFMQGFCAQLARRSGGALALSAGGERIARCDRVVGIHREGRLVGGFVVNDGPELVLLDVVPPDARAPWQPRARSACELNLIWRDPSLPHALFASVVWPRIIAECLARRRRFILGSGYDNPLDRWYRILDPELVYEGRSRTSPLHVRIYAYTRPKLLGTFAASALTHAARSVWPR